MTSRTPDVSEPQPRSKRAKRANRGQTEITSGAGCPERGGLMPSNPKKNSLSPCRWRPDG